MWPSVAHEDAQLPLVATLHIDLARSLVKHYYNLTRTVRVRAPYHVFCDSTACDAIGQARADARRWLTTSFSRGWDVPRLVSALARAFGVEEAALLRAARRSADAPGDRMHCPSAELVLIWLAKPVMIGLAMAQYPERERFAWVDAGFAAYRGAPRGVPPAPWLKFWPDSGLAVRFHPKCCKPPHIRPSRNGSCVEGTYLYGSRASWERFISAYVAEVARLVRSQEEWSGRRSERLLCADQDIITDLVARDASLVMELLPEGSWKWHDISRIANVTSGRALVARAPQRSPAHAPFRRAASLAAVRSTAAIRTAAVGCAALPAAHLGTGSDVRNTTAETGNTTTLRCYH